MKVKIPKTVCRQPRGKPVGTNRENDYFFLSSRQKLKPPPNKCPISPPPLQSFLGQHGNYTRWVLDQDNFEQGVGRGFTFSVQRRREQGAKVRKQMELSQQFCPELQIYRCTKEQRCYSNIKNVYFYLPSERGPYHTT